MLGDEKLVDPDFEGSIFQKIGLTADLCPHCKANLPESGCCLNLCTMPTHMSRKFNAMLAECYSKVRTEGETKGVEA